MLNKDCHEEGVDRFRHHEDAGYKRTLRVLINSYIILSFLINVWQFIHISRLVALLLEFLPRKSSGIEDLEKARNILLDVANVVTAPENPMGSPVTVLLQPVIGLKYDLPGFCRYIFRILKSVENGI